MSHQKAKLLHVEHGRGGVDWCRELYYKILMNPLTFAKMLVKKNLDDIELIQCVEHVKDEYSGVWKSEWSRIKSDEFLKLKYRRKERKEYIIYFMSGNVAEIRCWRREADIAEVSL
jgi:hypothetical protein